MNRLATAIALLVSNALVQPALAKEITPAEMVHVSVKTTEPKSEPNSFSAQPKEHWTSGSHYLRTEEAPDPKEKLHQLFIINPPDIWLIEQYTKKAKHIIVDKKMPPPNAIFGSPDAVGRKTSELRFGKELAFFKEQNAKKTKRKDKSGKPVDDYQLKIDNVEFELQTEPDKDRPLAITKRQGANATTFEYIVFERVPFKQSMFELPPGLKVIDAATPKLKPNQPVSIPTKN